MIFNLIFVAFFDERYEGRQSKFFPINMFSVLKHKQKHEGNGDMKRRQFMKHEKNSISGVAVLD